MIALGRIHGLACACSSATEERVATQHALGAPSWTPSGKAPIVLSSYIPKDTRTGTSLTWNEKLQGSVVPAFSLGDLAAPVVAAGGGIALSSMSGLGLAALALGIGYLVLGKRR